MKPFLKKINITRTITFNICRSKRNRPFLISLLNEASGQTSRPATLFLPSPNVHSKMVNSFFSAFVNSFHPHANVTKIYYSSFIMIWLYNRPAIWYLRVLKIAGQGSVGEVTKKGFWCRSGRFSWYLMRFVPRRSFCVISKRPFMFLFGSKWMGSDQDPSIWLHLFNSMLTQQKKGFGKDFADRTMKSACQ